MSIKNCCEEKINLLREELNEVNKKGKELKERYINLLVENLKKDVIIRDLKEKAKLNKYSDFEGDVSLPALSKLISIEDDQKFDSGFIYIALMDLHKGDSSLLKTKTLSGRSKSGDKEAISPEIKTILQKLFDARLASTSDVSDLRKRSLGNLMRNALTKIHRSN